MMGRRIAVMVLTVSALAVGAGLLAAKEEKGRSSGKRHDRLEALAAKLDLSDKQKEEVRNLHADFSKKAAPVKEELRELRREQREAMRQVLSAEQRAKLPEIRKAEWDKRWQALVAKLGLSDEQKQQLEKTRAAFQAKYQDLAAREGKNRREQFRQLRHEQFQAVRADLTDEQRAKLREEFHHRHNSEARREHWRVIGDKLGVSTEQKEQFQKIHAEYAGKIEKPAAQLKQLHQDQRTAVEKVLTEEQRAKLREMRKARGSDKEKSSAKKGE